MGVSRITIGSVLAADTEVITPVSSMSSIASVLQLPCLRLVERSAHEPSVMEGFPRFLALHRTNRGSRGSAEAGTGKKKGERWDGFVDKRIVIEVLFLVVCVDSVRRG